ncbi:MAG: acyltransferase family protein [Nannocystaceae bacterium]|nr:acyltransferase family protein [bacterium]
MLERRSDEGLAGLIEENSDAIRVCRVVCIVPVAYVHVTLGEDVTALGAALQSVFRDLLGRSSVLLLSVVSGLLMVRVFATRGYGRSVWGRVQGLLVPMVAWNVLAIAISVWMARPVASEGINAVLAVTDHGATRPLTFLRDLFVVSLATPALVVAIGRAGPWLLVPLALVGGFVSTKPVLAHSQILSYFAIGVGFGVLRLERSRVVRWGAAVAPWLLLALVVLSAMRPFVDALAFMDRNAFDALVRRPVCAASFWVLSTRVVRCDAARRLVVRWLEPAIFAMFLSHSIVLHLLRHGLLATGVRHPAVGLAAWLVLPLVSLAIAVVGQRAMLHMPGLLYRIFLGKPKPS